MKAVVLAGGFAKRLWPLTLNTPKPLLKVCGKSILDYIMEKLIVLKDLNQILITINKRFEEDFKKWLEERGYPNVKLIVEMSMCEEEKLGAIAAIRNVIPYIESDDVLIIAGDNLFTEELNDFIDFYNRKQAPIIGVYDIKDLSLARLYANVQIDNNFKVINLVEKPDKPISTLISMCLYLFPNKIIKMVDNYLSEGGNPDSPGYFIEWLYNKIDVYAYIFRGLWFDIGDKKSLERANELLSKFLRT